MPPPPLSSLCSDGPPCASPSSPPPPQASVGQGLNVTLGHQSAQPARVSWGEAGEGQRGAEGREALAPIVHYDGQELLTDSKSSASSRHAPSPRPAPARPVPALRGAPTSRVGHGAFVPRQAEHANFSRPGLEPRPLLQTPSSSHFSAGLLL